jgi:hypothetical protein
MSLAHFDEIYEIIIGMTEEEEVVMKGRPTNVKVTPKKERIPVGYRWWEEAAREIEAEKNKEKEGVYV